MHAQVLVTGHSLGGAVATLCAFDLARKAEELGISPSQCCCITFGAPRTGNAAFAKLFNQTVKGGCWMLVNGQVLAHALGSIMTNEGGGTSCSSSICCGCLTPEWVSCLARPVLTMAVPAGYSAAHRQVPQGLQAAWVPGHHQQAWGHDCQVCMLPACIKQLSSAECCASVG